MPKAATGGSHGGRTLSLMRWRTSLSKYFRSSGLFFFWYRKDDGCLAAGQNGVSADVSSLPHWFQLSLLRNSGLTSVKLLCCYNTPIPVDNEWSLGMLWLINVNKWCSVCGKQTHSNPPQRALHDVTKQDILHWSDTFPTFLVFQLIINYIAKCWIHNGMPIEPIKLNREGEREGEGEGERE